MEKLRLLIAGLIFASFSVQGALAEPYAPLAKLNAKGIKMMKLSGETEQDRMRSVPSAKEVDVPTYPGAVIVSVVKDESGQLLPGINLASTDPPEKVREWYKKRLHGWRWSDKSRLFHQFDGEPNGMQLMTTPIINILAMEARSLDMTFLDVPGAKTRIQITYKPKKD